MIKSQWGLRDPDQIDEKQTRSMLGDFGKVSKKFKDHTSMQDFGAECFEYEMELCGIKRVHGGWNWDEFTDSSGVYQITGSDPFNNPVPNIVAFMWNEDFFNPDYFVCYWTQTEKGSPYLKNKFIEVKGSSSIKNEDLRKYIQFQNRIDRHNEKVRLYAKAPFKNRCLLEFEILVYPTAFASGQKALDQKKKWTPKRDHIRSKKIYSVNDIIELYDRSENVVDLKSKHIFDPKRVKMINPHSKWTDKLFKKYI
jgi:hypothetical protein